jgi:hypothetical protein
MFALLTKALFGAEGVGAGHPNLPVRYCLYVQYSAMKDVFRQLVTTNRIRDKGV